MKNEEITTMLQSYQREGVRLCPEAGTESFVLVCIFAKVGTDRLPFVLADAFARLGRAIDESNDCVDAS